VKSRITPAERRRRDHVRLGPNGYHDSALAILGAAYHFDLEAQRLPCSMGSYRLRQSPWELLIECTDVADELLKRRFAQLA